MSIDARSDRFVASRYVSLAFDEDASLIVHSSRTGAIGVVGPDLAEQARNLLRPGTVTAGPLSGVAADLVHGGMLVAESMDEAQLVHNSYLRRYDPSALQLIVLPTEECNFRCVYCYESFERGTMVPELRDGLCKFVAGQDDLRRLDVHWFGGEPFLAPEVVAELMTWFGAHCAERDIKLSAGATTNGSLLTPAVSDQVIPLGVDYFQITLDGVAEEHDARRHAADGSATFETIIENLRYLRRSNLKFTVMLRHNFDPESLPRLDAYLEMIQAEFGGDERFRTHFEAIGKWGGPNDEQLVVCEGRTGPQAIIAARRKAANAGFRDQTILGEMAPDGYVCYAANPRSFVIGADGTVYKCTVELDYHERNKVGVLRPDGAMDLDWNRMALWCETDGMESGKKCTSCWFSPSCHGAICPKEWMDDNDVFCPPAKQTIRDTLLFVREEHALADHTNGDDPRGYCPKG